MPTTAPNRHFDVLIVGAGHGGAQAATALRQRNFVGTVGLVGDEPELPYARPPLSKAYLGGERPFERLLIRPASFWEERAIDVLTGVAVQEVEPAARAVKTAGGVRILKGGSYEKRIERETTRPREAAVGEQRS